MINFGCRITGVYSYSRILQVNASIEVIKELRKADHQNQQSSAIDKKSEEAKTVAEIKANIPTRTLMLEKILNDILLLPQLLSVLWKEIAEYEGSVKSSLLGEASNSNNNDSWVSCCIL